MASDDQQENREHGDGLGQSAVARANEALHGVREQANETLHGVREQANEALHGMRGAMDRASNSVREWSRNNDQWGRAAELGKGLRGRGERAVGGIAHQVEQNPLTSVTLAFAAGVLLAMALRR